MPDVSCPKCDYEQTVQADQVGGPVRCPRCRTEYRAAPRAVRADARPARRPHPDPVRRAVVGGLIWAAACTVLACLLGVWLSQYAPVFGDIFEKNLAQPWSPARKALIPIHLLAFGTLGLVLGGGLGTVVSYLMQPTRRRGGQ